MTEHGPAAQKSAADGTKGRAAAQNQGEKKMAEIRLDKYLAGAGEGTRSQVKEKIRKGSVTVNGQPVCRPEQKVDPAKDVVEAGGVRVTLQTNRYYMLYKPSGCVSATEDGTQQTVLDLLPAGIRRGLFPVGRLDKDTEGLLLLTDDGPLAHRLLSPRKHVEKTYFARVEGNWGQEDVDAFAAGLDIGDEKPALPARLQIGRRRENGMEVLITVSEGRYHQVKRMAAARNGRVVYLKRLSMGPLTLDEGLAPGQYRELTEEELRLLGTEVSGSPGRSVC